MLFQRFHASRLAVGAGAGAVAALLALSCDRNQPKFAAPPPAEVTVRHPVKMELDDYLDFTGSLRAFETNEVRPRVSGFIDKIHFQSDSHVKAGDLLFTIDPRPYDAALLKAQAELQGKQANLKAADVNLQRTKQLLASQSASELELVERTAAYDLARAEIATAEANIVTAKLDVEFTKVTAPISGRISRNLVDQGTLVGAADPTLLATIVNDEKLFAYFNVSESAFTDYVKKNPQTRVRNSSDKAATPVYMGTIGDTGYPYLGKVESGDNRINPDTGTYEVRAIFDNPQRTLTPGSYVKLRALVGKTTALLLPDECIQLDQQGRFVAVVKSDDTIERRPVTLGSKDGNFRRVMTGLTPEDRVVTNGLQAARPGVKVHPTLDDKPINVPSLATTMPALGAAAPSTAPANSSSTAPADASSTSPEAR